MPRGQYDRSAAKAKRTDAQLTHMMDTHLRVADVQQPQFTRPGFPYENSIKTYDAETDMIIPLTQERYDAEMKMIRGVALERDWLKALVEKYSLVLKRNGLWLDE